MCEVDVRREFERYLSWAVVQRVAAASPSVADCRPFPSPARIHTHRPLKQDKKKRRERG